MVNEWLRAKQDAAARASANAGRFPQSGSPQA
jgi:hypothetical protein